MKLASRAFKQGEKIPSIYTCDGKDINPPLEISGVPAGAKSLVLIMDDPDVPLFVRKDGLWVHWIVFNIPVETQEIRENEAPPGTAGTGTGGIHGYQGPCPPDREHRYFFKLYALDALLKLPQQVSKNQVEKAMEGHIMARTELMGLYVRTK